MFGQKINFLDFFIFFVKKFEIFPSQKWPEKWPKIAKNGQNDQNYVKKSISNTEYELKFDKNHSQLPFSMVFVGIDTYLIDI